MKPEYEDIIEIDQSPRKRNATPHWEKDPEVNRRAWAQAFDRILYRHLSGEAENHEMKPEELAPEEQGPQRFRKKPVTVEAIHNIPENKEATSQFLGSTEHAFTDEGLLIRTLEGVMKADEGDWIIRGISGEFYPCKPEIFLQTYDSV